MQLDFASFKGDLGANDSVAAEVGCELNIASQAPLRDLHAHEPRAKFLSELRMLHLVLAFF